MKVLIAFTHGWFGGLATYNHAIAVEFQKRGFEVDVWTLQGGNYLPYINKDCNLVKEPASKYDLIIVSNNDVVKYLDENSVEGYRIYITHGVAYENDIPKAGMADEYVAVSPFTHSKVYERTDVPYVNYIPQGVDCDRYRPSKPVSEKLTKVLSMVKSEEANNMVEEACRRTGVELVMWYNNSSPSAVYDIPYIMNEVDAVVGWGRVVIETMACGRAPICFDINSTVIKNSETDYAGSFETSTKLPGLILPQNIYRMGRCNFSLAAGYDPSFTIERLLESFKNYDSKLSPYYRNYAVNHYGIDLVIDRLLNLFRKK